MKQLYSRHFPTPSYLAMNSCAIDISDQSIKYAILRPTAHGLRLDRFGEVEIPAGVILSGKIENSIKLVELLTQLRIKEKLHLVRVSLPEEQMYMFTLSLPKMTDDEAREAILLQIEEHIPLSAVDTVFDYDIISDNGQTIVAHVTAISESIIESYISIFQKAGLIPMSFELEAQAIARAVTPREDKSTVMIVDFGETRTGVSIAQNGRVFLTTTLDIGGSTLNDMIAKTFSITPEKAEEIKRTYGTTSSLKTEEVFPIILNGISVIRDELNKQYLYWKTHNDDGIEHKEIERIILCGGDANLTGLADYLEASMKIKVEHANTWYNISDTNESVPDMTFEESLSYATALGLALGDYIYGSQPLINVLPEKEKKLIQSEYWRRLGSVAISLFALAGLIATVLALPSYFFSVSKSNLAETRLEAFNQENPEISTKDLYLSIADINSKLAILSRVKNTDTGEVVIIPLIMTRPKGIYFSNISYQEGDDGTKTVTVSGIATDRASLRSLKTLIDSNPNYSTADLPISDFLERSNINFSISIKLKN